MLEVTAVYFLFCDMFKLLAIGRKANMYVKYNLALILYEWNIILSLLSNSYIMWKILTESSKIPVS